MHIADHFFVIESNNKLDRVDTAWYGFMVSEEGIFDKDNALDYVSSDNLSPLGAYVYVERKADKITIRQDANGAFGLCIYRDESFFAISNSVVRLIDHLGNLGRKLTVDRDYANMLIADGLCNMTLEDSIVNEIRFVEPGAEILIDVESAGLRIIPHRYPQCSLSLDTREGLCALDAWYEKWTRIISGVARGSDHLAMDLSGGFDTRLAFAVTSGIGEDICRIRIRSYTDKTHTHAEDFKIASGITEAYGVKLNDPDDSLKIVDIDKDSTIRKNLFSKLSVHKELFFMPRINITKQYRITGDGGESVRTYCDQSKDEYSEFECGRIKGYSESVQDGIRASVLRILDHDYGVIHERYPELDNGTSDDTIALFRATYNRNHFGRNSVESCVSNVFRLEPLLDPDLFRIRMYTDGCQDRFLLAAMILVRFCPRLLDFPIEGGRKIADETLAYAKKLSDRFPYQSKEVLSDGFIMPPAEDADIAHRWTYHDPENPDGKKNAGYRSSDEIKKEYIDLFESDSFREKFCEYFSDEIYENAISFSNKTNYFPYREINAILGIMYPLYDGMKYI